MRIRITTRWNRDPEAGSVLVFWGVSIVVLLGMVALSFDIGRISATQSELQSFADNLAVAAAAELGGEDDSVTRAITAAAALVTDSQTFGAGGRQLTAADYRLEFFERGDTGIGTAINGADGFSAAEQAAARYVRAVVGPRNVGTPFAAVLGLISDNALVSTDVGASAMAGAEDFACDITPLMFCVPANWGDADQNIGQMIKLKTGGGNNSQWAPGDFGYLDPSKVGINPSGPCANKTGNNLDTCLIAAERATAACFSQDSVDVEPGQKVGAKAGFNVVFDIYFSTAVNLRNDPDYTPAPNVIKGIKPQPPGGGEKSNNSGKGGGNENSGGKKADCIGKQVAPTSAKQLPRDSCIEAGTCRFGAGDWRTTTTYNPDGTISISETGNYRDYVDANHNGADPTTDFDIPNDTGKDFDGTRYEMYVAEIAKGSNSRLTNVISSPDETGIAACYEQTPSTAPSRRVFIAAAIDCETNKISGAAKDVPVQEFVRIFLTEPVGYETADFDETEGKDFDIHIEVLGSAEKQSAVGPALIRRVVRLVE